MPDLDPFESATAYFGASLRQILDTGVTRQDMGHRIKVQTSTVSRLINGSRLNPMLSTVLRTAYAYDMEPATLMPTLAELKAMVASAEGADRD